MNTTSQSDSQNLDKVLEETIDKIDRHAVRGDYIYRGEQQCYAEISSNLYRAYADLGVRDPTILQQSQKESAKAAIPYLRDSVNENPPFYLKDIIEKIDEIPQEFLPNIREYLEEARDFDVLAQIQHYGGKTNLIDFTTDYRIALFFACNGFEERDGRIILLENKDVKCNYKIKKMFSLIRRAETQKSIFVEPLKGVIDPTKQNPILITIPKCLKKHMLNYLRNRWDISAEFIYNDLHGLIQSQDTHLPFYKELYTAKKWFDKGTGEKENCKKRRKYYGKSVESYTRILNKSDLSGAYDRRGGVYTMMGEFDKAIENYSQAIKLDSEEVVYYSSRGFAYRKKGDLESAKTDYRKAIELNPEELMYYKELCLTLLKSRDWKEAEKELNRIKDKGKNIKDKNKEIDDLLKELEAAKYCERCNIHLERNEWRKAREELKALKKMENFKIRRSLQEIKEFVKNEEIKLPEDLAAMLENC